MTTTTEATPPPPDVARPGGSADGSGGSAPAADPYLRGTDETVLLDLRELRAQQAAEAGAAGRPGSAPGTDLEAYQGSHRREAMLYAHGGTAIPLERVREVCHDLRQPVAAILMLASAAEMRPDVPERVRDVLQEIMTQTEDISATVRQFLDDAKQGVDGLGDPVPCNVAGLAAESVERWRATFSGRISLAAAGEPLHVTVDPVLFKRALGNVLSNGTRAAGGGGRVQVTVRRFETGQGERAVIEVDDSGPGFGNIPAGHGLGLAVVRRTVEAAGGAVEVAEGPLGGALIRLVLPVTPARPLSSGDEAARTIHGEISLSALAEELAAGGGRPSAVEYGELRDGFDGFVGFDEDEDDDDEDGEFAGEDRLSRLARLDRMDPLDGFEGFDDFDEDDEFDEFDDGFDARRGLGEQHSLFDQHSFSSQHSFSDRSSLADRYGADPQDGPVAGGHAFATRISARPETAALTGAPEQAALSGSTAHAALFGAGSAPRLAASAIDDVAASFDAFRAPQRERSAGGDGGNAVPDGSSGPLRGREAGSAPGMPSQASAALTAPAQALEGRGGFTGGRSAGDGASTGSVSAAAGVASAAAASGIASDADPSQFQITATGQDDTAVAAIRLPSRADLTHPPRIPASALRPVASVQLSLLPGGAF